ncbi:MAG: putative toxin, partial [Anaerolineae bacterium]|nr:putative toxin [Anaerolineae bacterium]
TAITANSSGSRVAELRYKAWGEARYTWGTTPTAYRFTGQREDATIGLYFYNARYYDPALGRFIQPDSLVQADAKNPTPYLALAVSYANPKILEQWNQLQRSRLQPEAQPPGTPTVLDPQFLNRYSYVRNNPLAYVDDTGHIAWWVVGGVVGGVVGFGAYALTHRENFSWGEAALWTAGGAVVGATFGAGAQWVAGALGTQAAATAATAAGAAASSPAGQRVLLNATTWQQAEQMLSRYLGVAKNTQNIFVQGMSQARRPDFINLAQGYIAEAKWVQNLYMSDQIRDIVKLAQTWGVKFDIYVRQGTHVSEEVLKWIRSTGGDVHYIFK